MGIPLGIINFFCDVKCTISTFYNLDVYLLMKYVYEMVLDSIIRITMHLVRLWFGLRDHYSFWGFVSLGCLATWSPLQRVVYSPHVSRRAANFTLSLVPNQITSSTKSLSPITFPPHWGFIIFLTQRSQTA